MATRVIEVPRHLRLVKSKREERTPAELAARLRAQGARSSSATRAWCWR